MTGEQDKQGNNEVNDPFVRSSENRFAAEKRMEETYELIREERKRKKNYMIFLIIFGVAMLVLSVMNVIYKGSTFWGIVTFCSGYFSMLKVQKLYGELY